MFKYSLEIKVAKIQLRSLKMNASIATITWQLLANTVKIIVNATFVDTIILIRSVAETASVCQVRQYKTRQDKKN